MNSMQRYDQPEKPSLVKKGVAGLVLVVIAALALKVVIGFVIGIFWVVVAIAAIIAVAWAAKTLL
jgi:hypothetical protein